MRTAPARQAHCDRFRRIRGQPSCQQAACEDTADAVNPNGCPPFAASQNQRAQPAAARGFRALAPAAPISVSPSPSGGIASGMDRSPIRGLGGSGVCRSSSRRKSRRFSREVNAVGARFRASTPAFGRHLCPWESIMSLCATRKGLRGHCFPSSARALARMYCRSAST